MNILFLNDLPETKERFEVIVWEWKKKRRRAMLFISFIALIVFSFSGYYAYQTYFSAAAGTTETAAGTTETAAGTTETAAGTTETAAGTTETAAGTTETAAGTGTGTILFFPYIGREDGTSYDSY
jgi:hypothetical protein